MQNFQAQDIQVLAIAVQNGDKVNTPAEKIDFKVLITKQGIIEVTM